MPSCVVMAVRKNSVTGLSTPPARSEAAGERVHNSSQPETILNSGHNGSKHVQNPVHTQASSGSRMRPAASADELARERQRDIQVATVGLTPLAPIRLPL